MYVIYLSSELITNSDTFDSNRNDSYNHNDNNVYGYWTGKDYIKHGELFPHSFSNVTYETKVYQNIKRAEKGLEACLSRGYAYVVDGIVRELPKY